MAQSSQGILCIFNNNPLTVTSVQVSQSTEVVDATNLNAAPNARKKYVNGFAFDHELTVDVISTSVVSVGQSGDILITGGNAFQTFNGTATVQSSTVSGSVGDIMRGAVTFKLGLVGGFSGFS